MMADGAVAARQLDGVDSQFVAIGAAQLLRDVLDGYIPIAVCQRSVGDYSTLATALTRKPIQRWGHRRERCQPS